MKWYHKISLAVGFTVLPIAVLGLAFPQQVTVTVHCQTNEEVQGVYFETPLYEGWADIQRQQGDPSTASFTHGRVFYLGWQAHVGCGAISVPDTTGQLHNEWRTNNRSDSSWRASRDLVCDAPRGNENRTIYGRCTDK